MSERFKWFLSGAWLLIGSLCLILPVLLPSYPNPSNFIADPIGVATATMTILSFPLSLLGIPFMLIKDSIFGVDSNTIEGMYLNLKMLFVLGLAQWFWIVPRIASRRSEILAPKLSMPTGQQLPECDLIVGTDFFEENSRTPFERVIDDAPEKKSRQIRGKCGRRGSSF